MVMNLLAGYAAGDVGSMLLPCVRKFPWRKVWQPTSVFLPGKSNGQRSLAGYSPRGCKGSDTTEQAYTTEILLLGKMRLKCFHWKYKLENKKLLMKNNPKNKR